MGEGNEGVVTSPLHPSLPGKAVQQPPVLTFPSLGLCSHAGLASDEEGGQLPPASPQWAFLKIPTEKKERVRLHRLHSGYLLSLSPRWVFEDGVALSLAEPA